ncbi:hypothetical protein JK358_14500 [Nocardia sp. 2]|uniref:Mce-associated membrane protein n=1 Tax=Nocardia acididurans TaxID=2802282 RepID=A0ABS1M4N1_9NOCA|nr:hypothetical protein [Nocardia acididurans]MBL1075607.1 hypothetical protein [Nocardia acididurans]
MSQQKDSEQKVGLEKPAAEPTPETHTDASAPAGEATAKPASEVKPADPAEEHSGPAERSAGLDTRKAVTLGSIALLVVAAVAAAWFGGTWIVGGLLQDRPRAEARDEALAAAQQAAINITSMNLSDVDGSLSLARSSMTGDLLDSSTKNEAQLKQKVVDANVNVASKIIGGALTTLNSEKDQASTLIVFQVTESAPDKSSTTDFRYTWAVDVVKSDGVWKADQVQQVANPVVLSSTAPQQPNGQPATEQPGN